MSWNNDMSAAPKSHEDIWLYFPLEGLGERSYWDRVIACHWNPETELWTWKGRAYRSYSRGYEPTHWQPYTTEKPEPPYLTYELTEI